MTNEIDIALDRMVTIAALKAPNSQALADSITFARELRASADLSDTAEKTANIMRVINSACDQLEQGAAELDLSGPTRQSTVSAMRDELARRFPGRIRGG